MTHSMTWAEFYLICFAVGFCFSFFSFLFGGSRTGRLHLPHFHGHVGGAHLPSTGVVGAHAGCSPPFPGGWGGRPFSWGGGGGPRCPSSGWWRPRRRRAASLGA